MAKILKYWGVIMGFISALEASDSADGEPIEIRPSYKGRQYSVKIQRTK